MCVRNVCANVSEYTKIPMKNETVEYIEVMGNNFVYRMICFF